MECQCAKNLNAEIIFWVNTCDEILRTTSFKGSSVDNILELKERFEQTNFIDLYDKFIDELKLNIREYRNIEFIDDYLSANLDFIDDINIEFDNEKRQAIIRNNYEISFMFKVYTQIFALVNQVNELYYSENDQQNYSSTLINIFYEEMKMLIPDFSMSDIENQESDDLEDISIYDRYNFNTLKQELAALEGNSQKRKHIIDTLIDFEQKHVSKQQYAHIHTRFDDLEFVKLCKIELKRYPEERSNNENLVYKQDLLLKYNWKATDTDLLELITALHKNESIQRNDGKNLTRKELIEYFQQIFGLEIKDAEGKLTRATNRKINMTPFLDNLKVAFENYAEEKEDKQQRRR